jgi:uncharacterized damage-inducible protein DinB
MFTEPLMPDPRFPIGPFVNPQPFTAQTLADSIQAIADFPGALRRAVKSLSDAQLDTPYRDGGWTVRQVVHHCADSHMNSFIRMKLAWTEDNPTVKPYFEDRWAELADSKTLALDTSLALLDALHARWVVLLKSQPIAAYKKTLFHPEANRSIMLEEIVAFYAWHSNHHLAHVTTLCKQKGWN